MIIPLIHPIHGEKIATLEAEAKHDELRGWIRVKPSPDPIAVMKAEVPALEKRKPGRPKGS